MRLVRLWWMQGSWPLLGKSSRGGVRPNATFDDDDPSTPKHGWQYVATQPVNARFIEGTVKPRLTDTARAQLRSQSGPMASAPFTCCQFAWHTTFDPEVLRLLLLRRLWLLLPSSSCAGVAVHSIPVATTAQHVLWRRFLGSRGFAVKSAASRACREAGGRVSSSIRIQDMGIVAPNLLDERRVEVLVDGLPLVSAEVGGRRSEKSVQFLVQLAKAKVRHEPKVMRVIAQCAWMRRWRCMLACAAARAFTLSLLERRAGLGFDGPTPTTSDVVGDCRHFGAEVMRTFHSTGCCTVSTTRCGGGLSPFGESCTTSRSRSPLTISRWSLRTTSIDGSLDT